MAREFQAKAIFLPASSFILFALFARISGLIYAGIYSGCPWSPLQINRHVTFSLALQAAIAHGSKPAFLSAIVFKTPIFHRLVQALAHVVQDDPRIFIARHGKPDIVGTAIGWQVGTPAGIAHIAEIAQFSF
jgi:hypothetical protein